MMTKAMKSLGVFSYISVLAVVAALSFSGCRKSEDKAASPQKAVEAQSKEGAKEPAGKKRFAFVSNNSSTFWNIAHKGVQKAAAEFGVEAEMRIPANGQVDEQQRIIEELIAKKIDGVAISPIDPANMTRILDEAAAHMPVVTQDSDAPNSKRMAYIGTNNHEAGKVAGEEIKKALPSGGKIMIFVGRLDVQNAVDRRQGIMDAIAGTEIEVVDTRLDNADQAKAKQNVEDAIAANPDIAGLVGLWSYNGPAIFTAVRDAGKIGAIKIVCFDEEDATLQGIAEGGIEATIVQKPFEFGYQSVRLMNEIASGDMSRIPENKFIDTGVVVVNKANVAEFSDSLKKLKE